MVQLLQRLRQHYRGYPSTSRYFMMIVYWLLGLFVIMPLSWAGTTGLIAFAVLLLLWAILLIYLFDILHPFRGHDSD